MKKVSIKRIFSIIICAILAFVALFGSMPIKAHATGTSSQLGKDEYSTVAMSDTNASISIEKTYTFAGHKWMCVGFGYKETLGNDCAMLICVDADFGQGAWAGYLANNKQNYTSDYSYKDIHSLYTTTDTWWGQYGQLDASGR